MTRYIRQYGGYDFYWNYRGPYKAALFVKDNGTRRSKRCGTARSEYDALAWLFCGPVEEKYL